MNLPPVLDVVFRRAGGDVPGAEGPVFDRHGTLYCVASDCGLVLRLGRDGGFHEALNTRGIPAGLQIDRENRLWIADMKLGLLCMESASTFRTVVPATGPNAIRGCNDCAFDRAGNLYFTAPAGSDARHPVGDVYCLTAAGECLPVDHGFAFSNGIAVSPDGCHLFVAETFTQAIWRYDIEAPGRVAGKKVFATLPDAPGASFHGPDGLDFDPSGHLLAAHWGGGSLDGFDSGGNLVFRLNTPTGKPSNLHFGPGPDPHLWITEHTTDGVWQSVLPYRCIF